MLQFNLGKIFKARGITRPFTFFSKLGYTPGIASNYANSKIYNLNLRNVEKLCVILGCTPNDMLEWIPEKPEDDRKEHPLYILKKSDKAAQVTQLINSLSFTQLQNLEQHIQSLKNPETPKP